MNSTCRKRGTHHPAISLHRFTHQAFPEATVYPLLPALQGLLEEVSKEADRQRAQVRSPASTHTGFTGAQSGEENLDAMY